MTNKEGNKLALIVSYYLARFDTVALSRLGFRSFTQAFEETGRILDVKKNYVKLSRDEFDPAFSWRRGWIRPMSPQILRTIELFENMDEPELTDLVKDLLSGKEGKPENDLSDIILLLDPPKKGRKARTGFVLRGPTGRRAEEFFMQYFKTHQLPVPGMLEDTRDNGCGYDFKISNGEEEYYVEVKGLAQASGGVLFTDKEWKTAGICGDRYFLVLVRNLKEVPDIQIIRNPAMVLNPRKNIYTTLQVQWQVAEI